MGDEGDDRRGRSGGAVAAVVTALVLPVFYVLSIGPVAFAVEKLGWDRGPVKAFYAPVIWLHDHTPLKRPLEAYVGLWGVK